MLYKTHKSAGVLMCLTAFDIMRNNGLLAESIHPLLQLAIIYPACSWASTAPDLDHPLCNVKEQTPINIAINKLLHIGKCSHRSVQTHSVLFTGGFCILLLLFLPILSSTITGFDSNNVAILRLMLLGIVLGIASHLIMDSLTTAGVWLVPKVKFRLVPNKRLFATGGLWEDIVRYIVYALIVVMSVHIALNLCGYELIVGGIKIL